MIVVPCTVQKTSDAFLYFTVLGQITSIYRHTKTGWDGNIQDRVIQRLFKITTQSKKQSFRPFFGLCCDLEQSLVQKTAWTTVFWTVLWSWIISVCLKKFTTMENEKSSKTGFQKLLALLPPFGLYEKQWV